MTMDILIQNLHAAIAPCILLSGLGLLLLSMTNRLSRTIDRIRAFTAALKTASGAEKPFMLAQIGILYRRSRLLQAAIGLILISIFFVSSIMLMLFSALAFNIRLVALIQLFFTASLACLIVALILFFWDIRLSLASIQVEMEQIS